MLTFLLGLVFLESLLHSKIVREASPLPRLVPHCHPALHGVTTGLSDFSRWPLFSYGVSPFPVQPGLSQSPTASQMQTSQCCSPGNYPSQTPWQTNPNHFKAWTSVSSCSEQKEHLQAESQNNYGATLGSPHEILFCDARFSMPERSCFIYCPGLWLFSVDSKSGITYWVMAGRSLWKIFYKHANVNPGPNWGKRMRNSGGMSLGKKEKQRKLIEHIDRSLGWIILVINNIYIVIIM